MKKAIKIISSVMAVILVVAIGIGAYILFGVVGVEKQHTYGESKAVNSGRSTGATIIDTDVTYQTMNGFGSSACWWSKDVGGWENCDEILSYLYDDENGIGLNIYRYNLGAGSADDESLYVVGNRTECFMQADGSLDFSVDANAQNSLAVAKSLAGDNLRVSLFCNSAPTAITKNGKAYCSAVENSDLPWESNLDSSQYSTFADFCYSSAEYFTNQGYRVTSVSPANEPQYRWNAWFNEDGSYSMNQEGCFYYPEELVELYSAMIDKFDGSELDKLGCKLSMFESGAFEGDNTTFSNYTDVLLSKNLDYAFANKKVRNYFDTIEGHSYWSDSKTKKISADYLSANYSNYSIACTEYCQMTNDSNTGVYDLINAEGSATNGMTIEYGVAMADVIITDLTVLNAVEWDWWLGCSYGVYTDGLVYINGNDHSDIQTSKRLWCLGNFSKFIEEGATRIASTSGNKRLPCCAFLNPDDSIVIVYVNSTNDNFTTSLKNLAEKNIEIYTTDAKHNLECTYSGKALDSIDVESQSVITIVIK